MDEARKNAFRRILYAAMLDFRGHYPISPEAYDRTEKFQRYPNMDSALPNPLFARKLRR